MALKAKSMFLYGLEVSDSNQNLPFRAATGGLQLNAIIPAGYYSLTDLASTIATAMNVADPAHTYTVTIDRTVAGGTQNRITIATNGSHLELLFATGTTASSSIRDTIAFGIFDYTGATSYTNGATAGVTLVTDWWGFNYQPPEVYVKNFGNVNVSTNGQKEAIVWSIQRFIAVEFKYEPISKTLTQWAALINWMIQQKPFDFTPEISSPTTVYDVTLEKSTDDGKGLGFNMKEMLPQYPFFFTTGSMTFRVKGEG
jgi:hypothetical protein